MSGQDTWNFKMMQLVSRESMVEGTDISLLFLHYAISQANGLAWLRNALWHIKVPHANALAQLLCYVTTVSCHQSISINHGPGNCFCHTSGPFQAAVQ